ncbi:MAG TPA: hypothetical protein VKB86_13740 [Pyrinomonadaceae bacterium]|nr:hypothetical protein [Pyrinomonadaceae bacterium]
MTITLETVAILLSIISFIVTVLGFFASLKFYRDGVELQKAANEALTKVGEKTESIQAQVGGIFDKTLDAALGRRYELSTNFEELEKQLSNTKEALLAEVRGQIGEAGAQQQQRIKRAVEEHIRLLKEKVESTRESAEEIADSSIEQRHGVSGASIRILKAMISARKPLSSSELGQYLKQYDNSLKVSDLGRRLRELSMNGYIILIDDDGERRYLVTPLGLLDAGKSA